MTDRYGHKATIRASILVRAGVPSLVARSIAHSIALRQCHEVERMVEQGASPMSALQQQAQPLGLRVDCYDEAA